MTPAASCAKNVTSLSSSDREGLAEPDGRVFSARPADHSRDTVAGRIAEAAGYTVASVIAARTGFHGETVRRYLCGRTPSIAFVRAFCDAYGVSADWVLMVGEAGTQEPATTPALAAAPLEELVGELARRVRPRTRAVMKSREPSRADTGGKRQG